MNKRDFIKQTAAAAGVTQEQANKVLNAVINTIKANIITGEPVKLKRFGTFSVKTRSVKGRDFATGAVMPVKKQRRIFFEPADALKTELNAR